MTISNQGSTLTVTDDLTSEKARLHLILYGDEDLYNFNILVLQVWMAFFVSFLL